jgi:thioredoxin reductase (NADPH)
MNSSQSSPLPEKLDGKLENSGKDIFDVTIIGGGPVGLFAAFYAGMRSMKVKIIDALPEVGGQLSALYPEKPIFDIPGFSQVLAKDLVGRLREQTLKFKPSLSLNERVVSLIRKDDHTFELKTNKRIHYSKTVIICAGIGAFAPNKLDVPGVGEFEERGLHYFVKDTSIFANKKVLVIGGGDSAVDWALSLKEIAKKVLLIHRRDRFTAHEESIRLLTSSSVEIKLNHELREVRGNQSVSEAVILDNKTMNEMVLQIDAVLINIGHKADLGPIREWGLELGRRSIMVNGNMETNIPGVYAAGDVATPTDSSSLNLIVVGFGQSALAVNLAKKFIDPNSSIFPGHSSENK